MREAEAVCLLRVSDDGRLCEASSTCVVGSRSSPTVRVEVRE
jgi:hypothetical protein